MTVTRYLSALTLIFACNASADLQVIQTGIQLPPADEPAARTVGSIWKGLKDGQPYTATLVSETDSTESYEDSAGCTWTRHKGWFIAPATEWANCEGNTGSATVDLNGSIFPLTVGKSWSYDVDGGDWQTARDCEVEDAVRVKTGLGEHDTFKWVCTDKWNTRTRYYSPALQTNVHTERHRRHKAQFIRYEFIKFE